VETDLLFHCRGTEFIMEVIRELENGKLPADVASGLEELYYNYKNAVNAHAFHALFILLFTIIMLHIVCIVSCQVLQNGDPNAYAIMISNMMAVFDRVLLDCQVPTFNSCCINNFFLALAVS
jgi:glycerol-3-phosphate O-acyltransferase